MQGVSFLPERGALARRHHNQQAHEGAPGNGAVRFRLYAGYAGWAPQRQRRRRVRMGAAYGAGTLILKADAGILLTV
ncbi:MAG: hypothetical protein A2W38_06185 [Deltaproteobacteria bacterium RBG_19FT_COMBO_58_16]|nr:MAG: hypothetical protein A2W38_06185 [Deltaproteobacteria bacterium RBG_19FT_COMBO_58_16]